MRCARVFSGVSRSIPRCARRRCALRPWPCARLPRERARDDRPSIRARRARTSLLPRRRTRVRARRRAVSPGASRRSCEGREARDARVFVLGSFFGLLGVALELADSIRRADPRDARRASVSVRARLERMCRRGSRRATPVGLRSAADGDDLEHVARAELRRGRAVGVRSARGPRGHVASKRRPRNRASALRLRPGRCVCLREPRRRVERAIDARIRGRSALAPRVRGRRTPGLQRVCSRAGTRQHLRPGPASRAVRNRGAGLRAG